jgi:hypothetical protein
VALALWRRAENSRRGVDRNALTESQLEEDLPPVGIWPVGPGGRKLGVGRTRAGGPGGNHSGG